MTDAAADDEIARKIIAIIAEQAVMDPADVRLDATPDDLGVDSLGLVEAVFAIEEAFDISIPYNANDPSQSEFDIGDIGSIVIAVKALLAEQKG